MAADLAKVSVQISGPYAIDWSKHSKTDVGATLKVFKKGGVRGSYSYEQARTADLKLVKLSIAEGALICGGGLYRRD